MEITVPQEHDKLMARIQLRLTVARYSAVLEDEIENASPAEVVFLATLIKTTNITENHFRIILAWNKRLKALLMRRNDLGVQGYILKQRALHG